jgi:hypothetical protein
MNLIHDLVAFVLLLGPVEPTQDLFAAVRAPLQDMAIRREILDPCEQRYVLVRPEDFRADLAMLRRRFQDLADAPPLLDSQRFPDRVTINDYLAFNRAYRQHIDVRQPAELSRWWELREALQETDHLYQVWDTARDARCDYYFVTVRRQALKKLRELIGPEAYYGGQMPPYVPLDRFRSID